MRKMRCTVEVLEVQLNWSRKCGSMLRAQPCQWAWAYEGQK